MTTEVDFNPQAEAERVAAVFGGKAPQPQAAPTPTPEAVNEPTPAPVEAQAEPSPAPAPAPPAQEEPIYKGSVLKEKFGTDNIDEIYERFSNLSAAEQKALELEQKAQDLEEYRNFVDNPYKNERLRAVDAFSHKTGVEDINVASRYAGKKVEEIGQNPIEALALAAVIEQPTLLTTMNFDKVVEAFAEQLGVDVGTRPEDLSAVQQLQINKALVTINAALNKPDNSVGKYEQYQQQKQQTKATRDANIASWQGKTDVKINTVEIDVAEDGLPPVKLNVPVSDATRQQIKAEIEQAVQFRAEAYTPELAKQMEDYARSRALQLEAGQAVKLAAIQAAKAVSGVAGEQAVKEFHNPAPVVRTDKPRVEKEVSEAEKQADYWKQRAAKYA